MLKELLQPELPWRMLLSQFMTQQAQDDYSYQRPSRREGDAIFPSLRSSQVNVVIAVDTSGSVKQSQIDEFLAEINVIKSQLRAKITLLASDEELVEGAPWIYEAWEELLLPIDIKGGRGTSFEPAFEYVNNQDMKPDVFVYFTDGKGKFPQIEPEYPVIWLIKGKKQPPWGRRVQLN